MAAACPSDDELQAIVEGRPSTARAHLETCPLCRAAVALAEQETVSGLAARIDRTPEARGGSIGRYLVLDVRGAGAMGVVYSAFDPELNRKIALKVLHPSIGEPELRAQVRERLLREAQAMAQLSHPNVISVYDTGRHGDDLYIAMKLIEGTTLTAWLRERSRPWREILAAFRQAGAGLAAAHDAGLIHRDFKPDNVLVSSTGEVCVTDFGLARSSTAPEARSFAAPEAAIAAPTVSGDAEAGMRTTALTLTGAVVGTPAYMAPEQLLGGPVDHRSDLFSFCVALHEALHGERPFAAPTLAELRARLREGTIREPASGRTVPAHLRRTLLRGLQIDPDRRPRDMHELLAALGRDPAARVRRLGWAAAAVAVVVVGAALARGDAPPAPLCEGGEARVLAVWGEPQRRAIRDAFARTGRPAAEAAWRDVVHTLDERGAAWAAAHRESCEATRLRGEQSDEMLDLRMACLDELLAQQRELAALLAHADAALLDRAAGAVRGLDPPSSCAADALVRGNVRLPPPGPARERAAEIAAQVAKAKAFERAGRYAEGARVAADAAEAAEREHLTGALAEARYWVGVFEAHLGHLAEAEQIVRRAAVLALATGRDPIAAHAYSFLGYLLGSQQQRYGEAHLALEAADGAVQRMGGDRALTAYRLRTEASVLTNEHRFDAAIERFHEAIELRRQESGDSTMQMAELHMALSRALADSGRDEEALAAAHRAAETYERLFGPDYAFLGSALLHEGAILQKLHRRDAAIATLERSVAVLERAYGEHSTVVEALVYLGGALLDAGQPGRARPVFERAAALGERIHTPYPDVPVALGGLGEACAALGELVLARAAFERALAHPLAKQAGPSLGDVQLGLAKVLTTERRDPARARELALAAKASLADAAPGTFVETRAELDRWLAEHGRP